MQSPLSPTKLGDSSRGVALPRPVPASSTNTSREEDNISDQEEDGEVLLFGKSLDEQNMNEECVANQYALSSLKAFHEYFM